MLLTRRGLITGLASFLAAPAIVRASSLMPVKAWEPLYGRSPSIVWIDEVYDDALAVTRYREELVRAFEENYPRLLAAQERFITFGSAEFEITAPRS